MAVVRREGSMLQGVLFIVQHIKVLLGNVLLRVLNEGIIPFSCSLLLYGRVESFLGIPFKYEVTYNT